jgi:hypothetical protein
MLPVERNSNHPSEFESGHNHPDHFVDVQQPEEVQAAEGDLSGWQ